GGVALLWPEVAPAMVAECGKGLRQPRVKPRRGRYGRVAPPRPVPTAAPRGRSGSVSQGRVRPRAAEGGRGQRGSKGQRGGPTPRPGNVPGRAVTRRGPAQ